MTLGVSKADTLEVVEEGSREYGVSDAEDVTAEEEFPKADDAMLDA